MIEKELVSDLLGPLQAELTAEVFRRRLNTLSEREVMVLSLYWVGKTSQETAQLFNRSERTVEVQRANCARKLGMSMGETLFAMLRFGFSDYVEMMIQWTYLRLLEQKEKRGQTPVLQPFVALSLAQ